MESDFALRPTGLEVFSNTPIKGCFLLLNKGSVPLSLEGSHELAP